MNDIDRQLIALARSEDLEEAKKKKKNCDSEIVTLGNPAADIKLFNMRAGSDGELSDDVSSAEAEAVGETALAEADEHKAKPEADLKKAHKDAIMCAKVYHKPVIYGYMGSDHHGSSRYFTFDDPIICNDLEKDTANVMTKYHPSGSVLVAYPDKPIIESASLREAKRYVRRYYIKPHNIFCSNKAEVLKTLIEHENEDCIVYTLLNLGDDKDVAKLNDNDVIYYYEDLVLYDKNHVRIMDYDLSIKKEEEREKINPDKVSDEKLADVYSDRMTELTELDESKIVKGDEMKGKEQISETKEGVCCICGGDIEGYGNNAEPYAHGKCCDACNFKFVIPARLEHLKDDSEEKLSEAALPKYKERDFTTIEEKKDFNRKWAKSLRLGTDKIPSCLGKSFTLHKSRRGREYAGHSYKILDFGVGGKSGDILMTYQNGANKSDVYLNAFFGRIENKNDTEYFLTADDSALKLRLDIYAEDRREAVRGYKGKAMKTIAELSDEEKESVKEWLLRHIAKIEFEVPCGNAGNAESAGGEVSGDAFKKYAEKYLRIQNFFTRAYPEARGMKPGEVREIGKDVTVEYVDVSTKPQKELSYFNLIGLVAKVYFDVRNSELPESVKVLIAAAKNTPWAKQAGAKDEINEESNYIGSVGFVNAIFELFDNDVNFLAKKNIERREDIEQEEPNDAEATPSSEENKVDEKAADGEDYFNAF